MLLINRTARRFATHSAPWMKGKPANIYKKQEHPKKNITPGLVLLMTGTMGSLRSGRLSLINIPQEIREKKLKKMKCGFDHAIILHDDCSITSLGDNRKGQSFAPDPLHSGFYHFTANHDVDTISCGARFTFIYKKGTRKCRIAGHNEFHQLFHSSQQDFSTDSPSKTFGIEWNPEIPVFEGGFNQISCGTNHTLVLMESGAVYAFGCNLDGQLGTGTTTSHNYPYSPKFWGSHQINKPVLLHAGHGCSLFIGTDGKLFGCGKKDEGRIGLSWDPTKPVQLLPAVVPLEKDIEIKNISSGLSHCTIINKSGQWYTFGGSQKLGTAPAMIKDSADHTTPWTHQAHSKLSFRADKLREVVVFPDNKNTPTPVKSLSSGKFHTVGRTQCGSVWCSGWGGDSQLSSENADLPSNSRVLLHQNKDIVAAEASGSGTIIAINATESTSPSWTNLPTITI